MTEPLIRQYLHTHVQEQALVRDHREQSQVDRQFVKETKDTLIKDWFAAHPDKTCLLVPTTDHVLRVKRQVTQKVNPLSVKKIETVIQQLTPETLRTLTVEPSVEPEDEFELVSTTPETFTGQQCAQMLLRLVYEAHQSTQVSTTLDQLSVKYTPPAPSLPTTAVVTDAPALTEALSQWLESKNNLRDLYQTKKRKAAVLVEEKKQLAPQVVEVLRSQTVPKMVTKSAADQKVRTLVLVEPKPIQPPLVIDEYGLETEPEPVTPTQKVTRACGRVPVSAKPSFAVLKCYLTQALQALLPPTLTLADLCSPTWKEQIVDLLKEIVTAAKVKSAPLIKVQTRPRRTPRTTSASDAVPVL